MLQGKPSSLWAQYLAADESSHSSSTKMLQGGSPESLPAPAAPPELAIPEANSFPAVAGSAMQRAPGSDGGLDDGLPPFATVPEQQSRGMETLVAIERLAPAVTQLQSTTLLDETKLPESDPSQVSQNLDLMAFLPRSSAGAKLKHFQAWLVFAEKHRHILDTRVKAEGVRNTFGDKEAGLREANAIFMRLLRDFQAVPSDLKVRDRLLKQSYAINTAQDQLQAAGDELREMDANLVKEEFKLLNLLPEILKRDAEPEDLSSILRKQGIDFRGETSYIQGSTAEASDRLFEAETDPEAQMIDTKLEAIRSLENNILSLREGRAKIVQETLISAGNDTEARERIYSELDNYDAQEKSLLNNLKRALAKLEILRKFDADVQKAEDETSIQLPRRSNPDFISKSSTPRTAAEDRESGVQMMSADTSRRPSLFAALRRLLHSQPMEEINVFPAGLISDTNGRADSFDVVNAWLFHHLRTSDDELKTYVDCLTRKPDLSKILSPEEILRHALHEWYNDITFKAHQAEHNTTNMTLGGDYSRVPFSTATSLKHGFGVPQRSPDHRQRAQPQLTPGAIRMAPLQPDNGDEEG